VTGTSILARFAPLPSRWPTIWRREKPPERSDLHTLWLQANLLPKALQSPTVERILDLLGPLDWPRFPERDLQRNWGQPTVPYAGLAAALLLMLNETLRSMSSLCRYLVEHPGFIWAFGFPLVPAVRHPGGFDPEASLPTQRHLTYLLRSLPNSALQFLLADSVRLILQELTALGVNAGDCISLDTKHILAWVKENNPKAYVSGRYDKDRQPAGDPDCRLGCKRRHNQRTTSPESLPTPRHNPCAAKDLAVGEFYWGYASGVVATKVPDWGEFVLAEMTQPFDRPDVSYFFALMAATERRLGFRPPFAAFDAAFDAFYVYEYFAQGSGFAAVPFSERASQHQRAFSAEGLPLCEAGFPMPLLYTFTDRSHLIEHERGRYGCPLSGSQHHGDACPVQHRNWLKKGCITTLPTSIGARLRHQIDRRSEAYKEVYKQRTASERINSQAVELGIERPHIRNGAAIANLNTLIYILINLRALQRIRQRKAESAGAALAA
jgi:hypothetical protein